MSQTLMSVMQLRSSFKNCKSKNQSGRKNGLKSKDLKKLRKLSKTGRRNKKNGIPSRKRKNGRHAEERERKVG